MIRKGFESAFLERLTAIVAAMEFEKSPPDWFDEGDRASAAPGGEMFNEHTRDLGAIKAVTTDLLGERVRAFAAILQHVADHRGFGPIVVLDDQALADLVRDELPKLLTERDEAAEAVKDLEDEIMAALPSLLDGEDDD